MFSRTELDEMERRMDRALGEHGWSAPPLEAAGAAAGAAAAAAAAAAAGGAAAAAAAAAGGAGMVSDLSYLQSVRPAPEAAGSAAPAAPATPLRRSAYNFVVLGVGNYGYPVSTYGPSIMVLDAARDKMAAEQSMERISKYIMETYGICPVCLVAPMRTQLLIPYNATRERTHLAHLQHKEKMLVEMYRREMKRAVQFHEARTVAAKEMRVDVIEEAQRFHSMLMPDYVLTTKREESYRAQAEAQRVAPEDVKAERFERAMHSMGKKHGHTMQIRLPADKGLAVIRVWRDMTGNPRDRAWRAFYSPEGNEPLVSIEDILPENIPQTALMDHLEMLRSHLNDDGVPIDVIGTGVFMSLYDMNESTQRKRQDFVEDSGSQKKNEYIQAHRDNMINADRVKRTEGETYRSLPKKPTPGAVPMEEDEMVVDAKIPGALPDAPFIAPATEEYAAAAAFPAFNAAAAVPESPARRDAAAVFRQQQVQAATDIVRESPARRRAAEEYAARRAAAAARR